MKQKQKQYIKPRKRTKHKPEAEIDHPIFKVEIEKLCVKKIAAQRITLSRFRNKSTEEEVERRYVSTCGTKLVVPASLD